MTKLTRADEIYQGIGLLIKVGKEHDFGVDVCAQHDEIFAGLDLPLMDEFDDSQAWVVELLSEMGDLGWGVDESAGELSFQIFT